MLINALVEIGKCIDKDVGDTGFDKDIVKFINMRYSDPPKMDKIIKINVKRCILDILNDLKQKIAKMDFNSLEIEKYVNKKFTKKTEKKEFLEKLINIINPDYEKFNDCISTELLEYKEDIAYKMLRGEQSGASVYISPTMFAKISAKKIDEFPLWKIKLDTTVLNLEEDEDSKDFIIEFLNNLPNMGENSKLKSSEPEMIFKFAISKIIADALNRQVESYNLKTGFYFFPICFNEKWPYDYKILRDYYKKQIGGRGKAKMGICEGCGMKKNVEDGLTGELGFFSSDQKSFEYSFFINKKYQLCDECKYFAEKGFNYVKKNLKVYLGSRGKQKNPYFIYVIPIAESIESLAEILPEINFKRNIERGASIENVKTAGGVIKKSLKSQEKPESGDLEENLEASEEIESKDDFINFIINIHEKKKIPRFELIIILFYNPDGQASDFHNIISINFIEYEKLLTLSKAFTELENLGKYINLYDIFFIFGIHKFRTYITKLLNLEKINLSNLCKDAYLAQKRKFFEFMADPTNVSHDNYTKFNLYRLNNYLKLLNILELI
ncbi:MAG: hypothetical protein ACP6IY_19680 [Promethearchaeia archaeon]